MAINPAQAAAAAAAPAAAAANVPSMPAGVNAPSNFASAQLPGFQSRNPNVPTIKFIASLIKGALMALSLGLGPGQMLFLGLANATAAGGKNIGPLADSKPASPIISGGGTSDISPSGAITGTRSSAPSARFPM